MTLMLLLELSPKETFLFAVYGVASFAVFYTLSLEKSTYRHFVSEVYSPTGQPLGEKSARRVLSPSLFLTIT